MLDKFRLLIVDDDKLVLDMMQHAAKRHEMLAVESMSNSGEAIERIKNTPPYHIILTDLAMPSFTGLDVLRTARAKSPDTRGIIVTGFGDRQSTKEAIKLGVSDYLHKPFRIEELDLALRNGIQHFHHRRAIKKTHSEIDGIKGILEKKEQRHKELEREVEELTLELSREITSHTPPSPNPAPASGGRVSSELQQLGTLFQQQKINNDEFHKMRKSILDRAYRKTII